MGSVPYRQVGAAKAAETATDCRGELVQGRENMFRFGSGSARLDADGCHRTRV